MSKAKNDKTFDAVTEEVVQAEAERAYLQDDSIRPEIPQDLEEKFHEITKLYDDYARAANLDEKDIEKDNEKLEKAFIFALTSRSTLIPSLLHSFTTRSRIRSLTMQWSRRSSDLSSAASLTALQSST